MNFKLQLASLFTLSILSGFVIAIILAASYWLGVFSWYWLIILTLVWNLLVWLCGPWFSDLMFKWFYKMEFYDYEIIKNKPWMKFIKKVCDKHNMPVPKIGIINDQNPTAFTYGSAAYNARVVFTEGLFTFLSPHEVEAVLAHEIGHIKNKDFIIMTIASTLLQLLYQFYVIFTRVGGVRGRAFRMNKAGKKGGGGKGMLLAIGYISLLFYLIGTYVLLYLSRIREYAADEFSARETGNANHLSSALIKIGYGIASVKETQKTAHLLNSTRAQGIYDIKSAKNMGPVHYNASKKGLIEQALLFDIVNPWAWILELRSTHPLVGKRIKRLCTFTTKPAFDFNKVIRQSVDKARLWKNFIVDLLVKCSMFLTFVVFAVLFGLQYAAGVNMYIPTAILFVIFLVVVACINIIYRFPTSGFTPTTILDCMADVYASPVRGKPVALHGQAVGRGKAGYVFSEDMMFQDKTGIIYLNYESAIPLFGNLFFAWKKLEHFLKRPAQATGWFLRGATHHIELYHFKVGHTLIKSYVRFWSVVGVIILFIFLAWILFMLGVPTWFM
jgi:Zn-dependent protease with chaperone function